jgi:uncharacterized protein
MDVTVRNAPERRRYEAVLDDEVAGFSRYFLDGDLVVFTHTEVDDRFEGRGVGTDLVRAALDDVRASGRHVVARCPFVRSWIGRHPQYADLVAEEP